MLPKRKERLDELFNQELASLIRREVEFPGDLFVTITRVDIAPDLSKADIFIEVIPENKKGTALEILRKQSKNLQSILFKKLALKKFPAFNFLIDQKEEKVKEIENILANIKKKGK